MPAESPETTAGEALLLSLFANPDADFGSRFAELAQDDWQILSDGAERQRGEVLLRQAIQRSGDRANAPKSLCAHLAESVRYRTFDALRQAAALGRVSGVFEQHGIVPIALKGVRLAWHTYPFAALRPMRDLDLLLPPDQVERAQRLLLSRPDYLSPDWAGRYGVEYGHQLPEIVDRETGVVIELHHRLNARGWAQEARLIEMMNSTSEVIEIAGHPIRVPSAHANVLHLIEHATLHHLFDNGPAVLADLHYADARSEIDWPLLREQADGMGLTRALALIGAVAARHGAVWPEARGIGAGPHISHEQFVAADAALLRGAEEREHFAFLRRLETRTEAAPGARAAVRAGLSPGRAALAEIAGTSPDSPLRWIAYPIWLTRRISYYVATRRARASGESSTQVRLLKWLHGE